MTRNQKIAAINQFRERYLASSVYNRISIGIFKDSFTLQMIIPGACKGTAGIARGMLGFWWLDIPENMQRTKDAMLIMFDEMILDAATKRAA